MKPGSWPIAAVRSWAVLRGKSERAFDLGRECECVSGPFLYAPETDAMKLTILSQLPPNRSAPSPRPSPPLRAGERVPAGPPSLRPSSPLRAGERVPAGRPSLRPSPPIGAGARVPAGRERGQFMGSKCEVSFGGILPTTSLLVGLALLFPACFAGAADVAVKLADKPP